MNNTNDFESDEYEDGNSDFSQMDHFFNTEESYDNIISPVLMEFDQHDSLSEISIPNTDDDNLSCETSLILSAQCSAQGVDTDEEDFQLVSADELPVQGHSGAASSGGLAGTPQYVPVINGEVMQFSLHKPQPRSQPSRFKAKMSARAADGSSPASSSRKISAPKDNSNRSQESEIFARIEKLLQVHSKRCPEFQFLEKEGKKGHLSHIKVMEACERLFTSHKFNLRKIRDDAALARKKLKEELTLVPPDSKDLIKTIEHKIEKSERIIRDMESNPMFEKDVKPSGREEEKKPRKG